MCVHVYTFIHLHIYVYIYIYIRVFPGGAVVRNASANAGVGGRISGPKRPPRVGNGNQLQLLA